MLTLDAWETLTSEIARLNGISPELAETYLALVGDTPEIIGGDYRRVLVRGDAGNEIARLHWPLSE